MSSRPGEFRWRRFPPLQIFLYLVLRTLIMVLDMFPMSMGPLLGRRLGQVVRFIDRKHGRIAVKNLEKSRGICAPDEIPAFIDRVYEGMGRGFIEMLMMPRLIQLRQVSQYVLIENREIVDNLLKDGRGVIITIGHLGNWELSGVAVAMEGYALNALARPVENPWIDRYLNRFRTQTGAQIIPKYHAMGAMVAALKRNELLVIQIDQDARHRGVYVNFFGRAASTHRSPALLALKYGTPIVPVNIYRDGKQNRCIVTAPILPEAFRGQPDPVKALTQAFSDRFESFVRQHPDQWFWVHDRWKTAERVARTTTEALV